MKRILLGWSLATSLCLAADTRFEISVPASAHAGPITGRVYVMISHRNEPDLRLQVSRLGIPFFGRDVEKLAAGSTAVIDATDLGSPVVSLGDIPPGEYWVQGFVNVYSPFPRADGHVVWMHDDQWEGQHWTRSPGNLFSVAQKITLDSTKGYSIKLICDQRVPDVVVPPDTEFVRRIKFQSQLLTKFWGRPIYLGATLLLPRDYDKSTASYPVLFEQGHFSLAAPLRYDTDKDLQAQWLRDDFPRMIVVTMQHPNPYFDDSYVVNSVNVGPYGDAIMQELIPEIENRFRTIRQPWARVLSGGSTGGWESLALQVFHPDFFGGTWSYCPDSVDFSDVEGVDIYHDHNAFYKEFEWRKDPTVNSREINGQIRQTSEERNRYELVSGTHGRSSEQLDIWSAVFGPLGADGYFEPLWNKKTGVMNPAVVDYWKEHYDLRYYLEKNWFALAPKLVDKIHIYVGDADNFFLNNGTRKLQEWMKTTSDPHYEGLFVYGAAKGHCYSGPVTSADRLKEMAQHILTKMPSDTIAGWWK
jgi:Putative esterase